MNGTAPGKITADGIAIRKGHVPVVMADAAVTQQINGSAARHASLEDAGQHTQVLILLYHPHPVEDDVAVIIIHGQPI